MRRSNLPTPGLSSGFEGPDKVPMVVSLPVLLLVSIAGWGTLLWVLSRLVRSTVSQ